MQTEQQDLIDLYLKNEEPLYKDWYATLHPPPIRIRFLLG